MTITHPLVQRASQKLEPGTLVHLYLVDLSPIGVNEQWSFCPSGQVTFQGIVFTYADVEADGFEWSGTGTLPQPKLRITNSTRLISGAAAAYQDLIGAKITRYKTYSQFLDDGDEANPDAMFSPEVYVFERKTAHNKFQVEWQLSAAMDQQGRTIPGRIVVRDFCMWRYRVWNADAGAFDYSKVQCPYEGGASFDTNGNAVSPDQDRPSRKLNTCCKVRFGPNAVYPFGGFPGVARTRV
jgi:lambda family phage minor tail protein L